MPGSHGSLNLCCLACEESSLLKGKKQVQLKSWFIKTESILGVAQASRPLVFPTHHQKQIDG